MRVIDLREDKKYIFFFFTLNKAILPVVYSLLSLKLTHNFMFCLAVCAESLVAFFVQNIIASWNKIVAWIAGVLLMFIVYAQSLVLLFTGGYVQLIMLTNLESVEALQGRGTQYIVMIVITLLILFLPIDYIELRFVNHKVIVSAICIAVLLCMPFIFKKYSPYVNLFQLIQKAKLRREAEDRIHNMMDEGAEELLAEFYSDTVGDGIDKPMGLAGSPNVVLIFTEGLSMNVIEDPREIMPNVAYYMENGLSFENYYDHTAATYRGIIGQLYSSHQYNNGDTNLLVSVEEILKQKGYYTTFVNPEPTEEFFTEYLDSLGFDVVTSGGVEDYILPDQLVYDLVLESLSEGAADGQPQFVACYTFGTHVGNNSPEDCRFGDGDNRLLNRFHYCDYSFGEFMRRLEEEGLSSNTLVVFTTDHASYVDDDYILSFYPDYERADIFCDRIPLVFYYDGITPGVVDAGGRNSLDLAPTVLDYLDIDSPNYFLGGSLFLPVQNELVETVFCVPDSEWMVSTADGELRDLTEEETEEFRTYLESYLSLTRRTENPIC